MQKRQQSGFALVFVLTVVLMLGAFVASALHASMSGARSAGLFLDITQADEISQASAQVIAAYAGQEPSRLRGGSFALSMSSAQVSVNYLNEAARIDVNLAPSQLFAALASAHGGNDGLVQTLAGRIDVFRKGTGGNGTTPRLSDPEQILSAFNLPPSVARAMIPELTVTNGTASVDPLIASREVLEAYFLGSSDRLDDFLAKRASGFASRGAVELFFPAELRGALTFDPSPAVRAFSTVALRNGFVRRYEIILTPGSGSNGAQIHSWRPWFGEVP